jgi:hypothetical protein
MPERRRVRVHGYYDVAGGVLQTRQDGRLVTGVAAEAQVVDATVVGVHLLEDLECTVATAVVHQQPVLDRAIQPRLDSPSRRHGTFGGAPQSQQEWSAWEISSHLG